MIAQQIIEAYERASREVRNSDFLCTIFKTSQRAHVEIGILIDADTEIFVSIGDSSCRVEHNPPYGARLPFKTWIHTHPSGRGLFSSIDWSTIRTYKGQLKQAIVLGIDGISVWHEDNSISFRGSTIWSP